MGVVEAVIRALLYLCGIALVFYLVIWVLGAIGTILILVRLFWPLVAGVDWFPRR
jgi:hypothetical protein